MIFTLGKTCSFSKPVLNNLKLEKPLETIFFHSLNLPRIDGNPQKTSWFETCRDFFSLLLKVMYLLGNGMGCVTSIIIVINRV